MAMNILSFSAASAREKPWLRWAIAITVALGAILEVIDTSIVNVALPDMQSTLGATLSDIGWVVTSYAIANVVIIPLSAWLGDYFGKKRYFIFSLVGFTMASVLCGLSTNLTMLIVARVLQGLTGGGLLAKAQSILFETFPKEEQGKAQALFGLGVIAGPAIGPTLGGYLTTNYSWPWIFYVNIPFGIVAVALAFIFLPQDPDERTVSGKVDWLGIGLLTVSLGSLQWMLEDGYAEDWFESQLITRLALIGFGGLALFIWRELVTRHPAVDLRVLRHRSLALGSIFSVVLGMGLYGALFAIPVFAQSVLGYTPQQTGMLMLPSALAAAVTMFVVGRIVTRVDARLLMAAGALIIAFSMFALTNMNPQTNEAEMYWPLIWRGVGTVMMFVPLSLLTLGSIPKPDIPGASGFYNLTRQMGGSIGIALLTTTLAQREGLHRSNIIEHLNDYSGAAATRIQDLTSGFVAKGFDAATAHDQAMKVLDRTVNLQSAVMSFGDMFFIAGCGFIAILPLILLLTSAKSKKMVDLH